jgi:hypothetical protein
VRFLAEERSTDRPEGASNKKVRKRVRKAKKDGKQRAEMVQDAGSNQHLLELSEQAEMKEFLRESRADLDTGRTEPMLNALERLAKKHNL